MDLNDKIARLDEAERDTFEVLRERFDAGESLILAEKVTAFEAEVYKTVYEGFQYNRLAPVVSDGPGLEAVGYYSQDQAGQAKFIADDDDDGPDTLRVWITAVQARSFAERSRAVVSAGRPPCPFCNQPLDARGHVCPRANGYRRRA
jgi:hypothetical protein